MMSSAAQVVSTEIQHYRLYLVTKAMSRVSILVSYLDKQCVNTRKTQVLGKKNNKVNYIN